MASKPAVAPVEKEKEKKPAPPPKQLKPEALDTLVAEYEKLGKKIADKQQSIAEELKADIERVDELEEQFLAQCVAYGSPHAQKSKLLSGLDYEVMTTESSSSSHDQVAIAVFRDKCEDADKVAVFDEMFEKVSEYRKKPAADEVVRRTTGDNKLTPTLIAAFMRCTIINTSPPRLSAVRPRKKEG